MLLEFLVVKGIHMREHRAIPAACARKPPNGPGICSLCRAQRKDSQNSLFDGYLAMFLESHRRCVMVCAQVMPAIEKIPEK